MADEKLNVIITATDEASGVLGKLGGGLGGLLKGGLALAGGAVIGGVAALGGALAVSVKEAMDAQEVQVQLNAVLESTGGAAGWTAQAANELSNKLMGITRYGDEAITSGQNLLLTFTNIGKDVFPEATQTILDMSTAMGQDVKSSALQLGKALNDPIAGMGALSRVGVQFTEEQKAMITGLVESGDVMGAQKLILQELQKEFGGSAVAAGSTFPGQLDILKNSLLNVAETAGTSLMPVLTEGLKSITPVITELATNLAAFLQSEGFRKFIADVGAFISGTLVPAIVTLVDWLSVNLPPVIKVVAQVWNENIKPALKMTWDFLKTYVFPVLKELGEWLSVTIPAFVAKLRNAWETDFAGIRSFFEAWGNIIRNVFAAFKAAFSGDWEGFGKYLREAFNAQMEWIKGIFSRLWEWFKNVDWGKVGKDIIVGIATGIENAVQWVIQAVINVSKAILAAIKGFLGISSPSKVFAEQVGKPLAQGLALGFQQSISGSIANMQKAINVGVGGLNVPELAFSTSISGGGYGRPGRGEPTIIINYQPFVSTMDRKEAELKLKPIILSAVRGA